MALPSTVTDLIMNYNFIFFHHGFFGVNLNFINIAFIFKIPMRRHYFIKINLKILKRLTITLVSGSMEQFHCHTFLGGA